MNGRMRANAGFTLIELMIVIAIVVLMIAVAYPAYQEHDARAQAKEAVTVMTGMKDALLAHHRAKGSVPANPDELHPTQRSRHIASIAFSAPPAPDGAAVALEMRTTFDPKTANPKIAGKTLHFGTRDGGATWQCSAGSEPTALPARLLPSACK
ncbi:Fimbrial protein [Candidatus Magnetaquicoccaceae bacterium FCR-1]|uniref:Fimbrial protein n=1 Tax=Candidatus Magnetaquiglobus chichijimensis TaxID=3141448 RepID=A0ABQ0C4Y4_9PROT